MRRSRPEAIVYEADAHAAARLAEELAACLHGRLVPVLPGRGRRRRARRLSAVAEREDALLLVVAVDVASTASCPVAIAPPRLATARSPLLVGDHVLWAVADHRDARCVPVAARMAQALNLPVTIAHVLPHGSNDFATTRLAAWFADGLLTRLAAHDASLTNGARVRISRGDAVPQLIRLAEVGGAALLVVGRRDRGPVRAAALGSVSCSLARQATTPLIICPTSLTATRDRHVAPRAA